MRDTRHTRRALAVAAVVPLLSLAVACGADDSSSDDAERDTSSTSQDASGAGTTDTSQAAGEEVDAKEFAERISSSFTDLGTAHMQLRLINGGMVMDADGQVDYTADSPRMAMTMNAPALGDGEIKARVLDNVMYMAMPELGAGASDMWFKVDLDDPNSPLGGSLGGSSAFDPKATVEMFGQGLEKVTLVGTDSVDGVATEHYQLTTSTAEFQKSLGDAAEGVDVPEELTYDVWLDEQDRMVKMEADLDASGSLELTMSKWDEPVKITEPPADKVQDFPEGGASTAP